MEMSIDDAIRCIAEIDKAYRSFLDNEYQALNIAVEIMRKYQKIKEIIANWNDEKINNIICCLDIKEVVEDGNDE